MNTEARIHHLPRHSPLPEKKDYPGPDNLSQVCRN
jgi:hypothetical protein